MLTLRLPLGLKKRLDALAKATGRSKGYHARESIAEYIGHLEDIHVAEKRLADI